MNKIFTMGLLRISGMLTAGVAFSAEGTDCESCHQEKNPGMYLQ